MVICSKETFLQYLTNISYCTSKHFFSQYCFWDSAVLLGLKMLNTKLLILGLRSYRQQVGNFKGDILELGSCNNLASAQYFYSKISSPSTGYGRVWFVEEKENLKNLVTLPHYCPTRTYWKTSHRNSICIVCGLN